MPGETFLRDDYEFDNISPTEEYNKRLIKNVYTSMPKKVSESK